MRRKFTVSITFPNGESECKVFHKKAAARLYCQEIGALYRNERLSVYLCVEGGGAKQEETFVKEPQTVQ